MSLPVDQVAGAGDLETAAGQRLVLVIRRVGPIEAVLVGPRERGVGPDLPDQRVAVSRFDKRVQSCGHPWSCPKAGPWASTPPPYRGPCLRLEARTKVNKRSEPGKAGKPHCGAICLGSL